MNTKNLEKITSKTVRKELKWQALNTLSGKNRNLSVYVQSKTYQKSPFFSSLNTFASMFEDMLLVNKSLFSHTENGGNLFLFYFKRKQDPLLGAAIAALAPAERSYYIILGVQTNTDDDIVEYNQYDESQDLLAKLYLAAADHDEAVETFFQGI